ncbi:9882_t:CDS:1, partial [Funneliformis mosseae]
MLNLVAKVKALLLQESFDILCKTLKPAETDRTDKSAKSAIS